MVDIPIGSKWRDPSGLTGKPIVIQVDSVDRTAANTVTGHSWHEDLPTAVSVWAGAPSDFERF